MPKITPNRISKVLSAENTENIKTAVQTIIDNLAPLVQITNDEYNALAKLGAARKPVYDKVLEVAEESPKYLEEEQTLAEVKKDKAYFEQIDDIFKSLNKLTFILEREQGVCGAEYRNALANYEANVKERVKKGITEAQLVLDKLNRIDRGSPTPSATPTAPATPPVK